MCSVCVLTVFPKWEYECIVLDGVLNQDLKYRFGIRGMRSVLARPSVYGVTIRDAIHKLLQKTSG